MSAPVPSTSVPDRVDANRMIWRELTSKNGKKFRVGREKPTKGGSTTTTVGAASDSAGTKPPPQNTPSKKAHLPSDGGRLPHDRAPFHADCDVYWEYRDGVYYAPAAHVKDKIDITEYQLGRNHFGYYDYKLQIRCRGAWTYTFYDEEGDAYGLECDGAGWHDVCYDSGAPAIVKVHAERWIP